MKLNINNNSSFFISEKGCEPIERFLSHILPYDPTVKICNRLEDGLKEYLLLLIAAEEAIKCLEMGELKSFDPLVGENACQIRAVKIALTISNCSFDTGELLERLIISRTKIEQTINGLSKINKRKVSLQHFLDNEKCDVSISPAEYFLIKSYILTKTKVLRPHDLSKPLVKNDSTNKNKIKEFSEVGSLFAKNFVNHLRKQLSKSSVKFIQQITSQFCPSNHSVKMVSQEFLFDHFGLHCIPCYWSTRVALEQALHHFTPIIMVVQQKAKDHDYKIVEETTLFFEPTQNGYKATCHSKLNPESPAVILLGSTCRDLKNLPDKENWIKELLKYTPVELTLACCAAHRQYPDDSKDHLFFEITDENYKYHKTKADEWGCSLENPTLFFLAHAYCDKVKNLKIS